MQEDILEIGGASECIQGKQSPFCTLENLEESYESCTDKGLTAIYESHLSMSHCIYRNQTNIKGRTDMDFGFV
jgi:hypothetical protein